MATDQKNLSNVDRSERFLAKQGPIYLFQGKKMDLRTIDTATAEALANNPGCMFLQWADPAKRPQHQRASFPAEVSSAQSGLTPKKA